MNRVLKVYASESTNITIQSKKIKASRVYILGPKIPERPLISMPAQCRQQVMWWPICLQHSGRCWVAVGLEVLQYQLIDEQVLSSSNSLNTAACICDLMPLRTPFLLKFSFNTAVNTREGKGGTHINRYSYTLTLCVTTIHEADVHIRMYVHVCTYKDKWV